MSLVENERLVEVERVSETERRARLLEAAALELEMRGWARYSACNDRGEVCVGGALLFALGRPPQYKHFTDRDMAEMAAAWGWHGDHDDPDPRIPLATWNDNEAQQAGEAAFLLRWRAAELRDGFDKPAPEGR